MNEHQLKLLLKELISSEINVAQTNFQLKNTLFRKTELGDAQPDDHRQ